MNPLAYFKIFNNEDCPCGSGKKFKECCKGKPDQQPIQSKKPPEVQIMEQMRKAMVKCCMHPDQSNCNGKIKNAHALQNNKIISYSQGLNAMYILWIKNDNHLLYLLRARNRK